MQDELQPTHNKIEHKSWRVTKGSRTGGPKQFRGGKNLWEGWQKFALYEMPCFTHYASLLVLSTM